MKLCHAAALGFVGWYLTTPPLAGNSVYRTAPLSEWIHEGSFDSAAECQQGALDNISFIRHALEKVGQCKSEEPCSGKNAVLLTAASYGQCIATDDPRLKGN